MLCSVEKPASSSSSSRASFNKFQSGKDEPREIDVREDKEEETLTNSPELVHGVFALGVGLHLCLWLAQLPARLSVAGCVEKIAVAMLSFAVLEWRLLALC
jgi:hypothetical protein